MDTAKIESDGPDAIKADLDRIAALKDVYGAVAAIGEPGFQSPVGAFVNSDAKNPNATRSRSLRPASACPTATTT